MHVICAVKNRGVALSPPLLPVLTLTHPDTRKEAIPTRAFHLIPPIAGGDTPKRRLNDTQWELLSKQKLSTFTISTTRMAYVHHWSFLLLSLLLYLSTALSSWVGGSASSRLQIQLNSAVTLWCRRHWEEGNSTARPFKQTTTNHFLCHLATTGLSYQSTSGFCEEDELTLVKPSRTVPTHKAQEHIDDLKGGGRRRRRWRMRRREMVVFVLQGQRLQSHAPTSSPRLLSWELHGWVVTGNPDRQKLQERQKMKLVDTQWTERSPSHRGTSLKDTLHKHIQNNYSTSGKVASH